jgi:antitoxin CptB
MKGCVLFGRFTWADESKNRPAGGWGGKETKQPPEEDGVVSEEKRVRSEEESLTVESVASHSLGRLRWHCRRGMLELDLVLARFLEENYAGLTARQRQEFETLLELEDHELWQRVRGEAITASFVEQTLRGCHDN